MRYGDKERQIEDREGERERNKETRERPGTAERERAGCNHLNLYRIKC